MRIRSVLWFFFFPTREQKKCSFSKTFLDTERLFGTSETERKERRVVESGARAVESGAKAGVPSGVAEAEDWATRSECSERNERRKCLGKIKKYQQYQIGFLWCHQIKKVNDCDIIWYANLAHFSMVLPAELLQHSNLINCKEKRLYNLSRHQ